MGITQYMNEAIHLKNSNLPKMIGDLLHSNQFLKFFSVVALGMATISMIVVLCAVNKAPTVIPLSPNGSVIEKANTLPKPQDEVEAAVKRYVSLRYWWEPKTVQPQLKLAQNFIGKDATKAYEAAIAPIVKFSTEKEVSQRVYPLKPVVDFEHKAVYVTGDRVTEIQGLKAAGSLKLTLFFDQGPRTPENPWGVYITKEKEEQ